jgi:hypothetical protein
MHRERPSFNFFQKIGITENAEIEEKNAANVFDSINEMSSRGVKASGIGASRGGEAGGPAHQRGRVGTAPEAALSVAEPALGFPPAGSNDVLLALARTNNFELRVRLRLISWRISEVLVAAVRCS